MYNPSRGGVRGGADQFTWESVKSDKHRENYLGHSLMAPVGRWQKGKDLSWYAKERKEAAASDKTDRSEFASIKQAEQEAMLIALGHNIVRKTEALSKEDIREALKRNTGERDSLNVERIDGVGASSQRVALLSGVGKDSKQSSEGVLFESRKQRNSDAESRSERRDDSVVEERKKNKKKSKKHKKEKKHKKYHKESYDSDSSDYASKHRREFGSDTRKSLKQDNLERTKQKSDSDFSSRVSNHKTKHKKSDSDSDSRKVLKHDSYKKSKLKHNSDSYDSVSKHKYDSDAYDNVSKHKIKSKQSASDSDSRDPSKYIKHKKSKHKRRDYSSDDSGERNYSKSRMEDHKRLKKQSDSGKRQRHDTSESD